MSQCLRITFVVGRDKNVLHSFVQKYAELLSLEGILQVAADTRVRVVACGSREKMDNFIDVLHRGVAEKKFEEIEVEPFLKDRDYRGVFRILE